MKNVCFGLFFLFLTIGCGLHTSQLNTEARQLVSGIDISGMDLNANPGDDFFEYVNGKWVASTGMPADKSRYGLFDILRDQSQENVRLIIEESASGANQIGTDEQKVGDLYKSFLDWDTRNALGISPLQKELHLIKLISTHDELASYFASALTRGLDAPINAQQIEDLLDPSRYTFLIAQGGLGLPDREYYLKNDEKSQEIRTKYLDHITRMLELSGLGGGVPAAEKIIALETRMAAQNMSKEQMRDYVGNYQKFSISDLSKLSPNFDWMGWLTALGLQDLDEIVVFTRAYVQAFDTIFTDTDIQTWRTYLAWNVLNNRASILTRELDKQNFSFYGTALSGTEEQRPDWRRAVSTVDSVLGEIVGRVYAKKHFPLAAKERMLNLVNNLVHAYKKSIEELDWMGNETKLQALDKLSKFTPMIGYPDKWKDYSKLEIKDDDLYGNLERAAYVEYERQLARRSSPVDRLEWHMNPQTVNAYYNPPLNQIVFPAAILQPPFFNMEADDAVNYGAIGAVIGHEIGHGFDDKGSTFDGDGVLRNWWTDEDRIEFEKRTGALVTQYNEFKPFEDLAVNGEFTLGENIGDLGGISIALLAYQISLDDNAAPIIDGFTGIQRLFLGFGQVWRGIIRDEALRRQIATDPHSPLIYRTNGPVRNVPEWYEAFEVSETDALYIAPDNRVKIW